MDQQNGFPGQLPEIPSGWSGAELDLVPGDGFWSRIEQIAVKGEMTRGLDTAMQGHSSPRIWLFLHEPGRGELSTAAAMSFARELAFRDQAALLLDCDDQDQALTRWAGRVEAEGWIDLARYGTSVLTSGVPMPFVGRRGYLLGVGSFAPTDVTGEEIDTLLTRLRRQADDLLLVAPTDSIGRLWAPAAAIRILCWDKQTMTDEDAAVLASGFAEAGCPLTAVATFQDVGAEEKLVDEVLTEVESAQEAPEVPEEPEEPEEPEPVTPPAPVMEESTVAVEPPSAPEVEPELTVSADEPGAEPDPEEETDWRNLPLEAETGLGETEWAEGGFTETAGEPEPATGRETSRVFWFGALVALVLISVATIYYVKFVRVPSEGHFEQVNVATDIGSPASGGDAAAEEATGRLEQEPSAVAVDSVVVQAEGQGEVDNQVQPPVTATVTEQVLDAPADSVPGAEKIVEEADRYEEAQPAASVTPPAEFDMAPYQGSVGVAGWALHVYSLPDSSGTAKQVRELDRRGFASEVRIFELGEKGRWWRIYLGSFSSRAEARQAMPALLEKLREDWAKPEKFSISAPE